MDFDQIFQLKVLAVDAVEDSAMRYRMAVGKKCKHVFVSPGFRKFMGLAVTEIMGKSVFVDANLPGVSCYTKR